MSIPNKTPLAVVVTLMFDTIDDPDSTEATLAITNVQMALAAFREASGANQIWIEDAFTAEDPDYTEN